MPRCVTENYTLKVPTNWADRSMITWVAPNNGKREVLPNILCSKDEMGKDENLDTFVNRQLKELMTKVENFDLIKREKTTFGGKPAVSLQFRMKPQETLLQQQQVYFQTDLRSKTAHTVVATAADRDFADLQNTFEDIFNSISWNN